MPADLVPEKAIPHLADQVSPAMRRVLQLVRDRGFIQNGTDLEKPTVAVLTRLVDLGLVDPGYSGRAEGEPFIWVSNSNGEKVLKHLSKLPEKPGLNIHPRAETALTSLTQREQLGVLAALESLLAREPASWGREEAARLNGDTPVFLLRVSPALRAFVRLEDSGAVDILDILREDTLQMFLERYRLASSVG